MYVPYVTKEYFWKSVSEEAIYLSVYLSLSIYPSIYL